MDALIPLSMPPMPQAAANEASVMPGVFATLLAGLVAAPETETETATAEEEVAPSAEEATATLYLPGDALPASVLPTLLAGPPIAAPGTQQPAPPQDVAAILLPAATSPTESPPIGWEAQIPGDAAPRATSIAAAQPLPAIAIETAAPLVAGGTIETPPAKPDVPTPFAPTTPAGDPESGIEPAPGARPGPLAAPGMPAPTDAFTPDPPPRAAIDDAPPVWRGEAAVPPATIPRDVPAASKAAIAGVTQPDAPAVPPTSTVSDGVGASAAAPRTVPPAADAVTARVATTAIAPDAHPPAGNAAEAEAPGPAAPATDDPAPEPWPPAASLRGTEEPRIAPVVEPSSRVPAAETAPTAVAPTAPADRPSPPMAPEAAPPPARPSPPIPLPVRQVAPFVVALALGPDARIDLTLEPAELGRVEVAIERIGGESLVSLRAERPETLALLQRDRAELERALNDAGLRGGEGRGPSLSFGLGGEGGGQGRDRRGGQAWRPAETAATPDTPRGPVASRSLIDLAV